jgi:Magnesium chelatase, subunit ChlI
MLARRLTTIQPAMTLAEAIETTRIHRVASLTGDRTAWVTTRPCRTPSYLLGCGADQRRPHTNARHSVAGVPGHALLGDDCQRNRPSSCLLRKETRASYKPSVGPTYGGFRISLRCSSGTSGRLPGAATLSPKVSVKTDLVGHGLGLPLTLRVITWPILILRKLASGPFPRLRKPLSSRTVEHMSCSFP